MSEANRDLVTKSRPGMEKRKKIRREEHANNILSGYISQKEENAMRDPWPPAYEPQLQSMMRDSIQADTQKAIKFITGRARLKGVSPDLAVRYGEYNVARQREKLYGIQRRSNTRHEADVKRYFKRKRM